MLYRPQEGPKTWIVVGVVLMAFAVHLFFEARAAERAGGTIRYSPKATWMSPAQAYVGSALSFAFGALSFIPGVRAIRRRRSPSSDENI